jgi:hypothetical protein
METMTSPESRRELRIEFAWGVTDGSAPEAVSVTWEGSAVPDTDTVCRVIDALAATGNRYAEQSAAPVVSLNDKCDRPSCGHFRIRHLSTDNGPGTGECLICQESVQCPSFVSAGEARTLLQEG